MPARSSASGPPGWSPPYDSDEGYKTKIGGSLVDQFVVGHDPTDVLRELVQNEFDAGGDTMAVIFGIDQLSVTGSGKPIDKTGWARLDVVIGTGRVAGDSGGATIAAKQSGIGSKNFGLRSLFLFGDRIYVRSNGRRAVQNLVRLATKIEADPDSRGQRGVSIHVPYRTEAFEILKPFTPDREGETFDRMADDLLATMVKLALPGRRPGIRNLTLRSDRKGRTLTWRQEVERETSNVAGVTVQRRIGRLTDRLDADAKATKRRFEEIEFARAVPLPKLFADVPMSAYYQAEAGMARIAVSLPLRLKRLDLGATGQFFYPLQTPSSATGSAVSVSAPFQLVADRSALLDSEWNAWLMQQAAELTADLLAADWLSRFGPEAYLAVRETMTAKPAAFVQALKAHLEEAACWPTASGQYVKASDLVIPEEPAFGGLLETSWYLRPDLAEVAGVRSLALHCGAKPFTRNSLIRLRCAAADAGGLATRISGKDANVWFTEYDAALSDLTRQKAMGRALAALGRGLSNENRRDLKSTKSTLAADGSLQAAGGLFVVDEEIWAVCQAPLATRLHLGLNGEKAITDLCEPFDLEVWVRAAAERALAGAIEPGERDKLYKLLLSDDLSLSRRTLSLLRDCPVFRDQRGEWVAASDLVLLPPAQARLLSSAIHAPERALARHQKLLSALRVRERLTGDDLASFAGKLDSEPEKAAAFEALLKTNPQLLTPAVVKRLAPLPFLETRAGVLGAPEALFVDNEINRICAADQRRILAGRNRDLYVRLRCHERPSVALIVDAVDRLAAESQPPSDIVTFYAALVQAVRAERSSVGDLSDRAVLWCGGGGYRSPRDVLVGPRIPTWFQRAVPVVRGPAGLVDSFEALGAATTPQESHWVRLFEWVGEQEPGVSGHRQLLLDAYRRRGHLGLPIGVPDEVRCLLARDGRLFHRQDIRSGQFVEDDFPSLAEALKAAGASIGFAEVTDDTRHFFGSLALPRLTAIVGEPRLAVGPESRPPPWFKSGHADRILALFRRTDFRDAVDLLVHDYTRGHGSMRGLRRQDVMDRLAGIQAVRFVTGVDRRYTVGGTTVSITTDAAAVEGGIALKPTRTKFEFEQTLTYALAELLGAAQVGDARRLAVSLLPLLMCDNSADMAAYLERQGLRPPAWNEPPLPSEDSETALDEPPSPQRTVIQSLLEEMFGQARTAGPDTSPPVLPGPPPAPPPPAPEPRQPFTLPDLTTVSATIDPPGDHAVAARKKPQASGDWSSGGSPTWRPPDGYDIDRDQKVGARGEEIVYLEELARVRSLGYDNPEDHVVWVSRSQPGADHDIRSIDKDGETLWLEVKSTMGVDGRFDWPQREFEKALRERHRYVLWRVYEAHTTHPVARAFVDPAGLLERSMVRVELGGVVGFVGPK